MSEAMESENLQRKVVVHGVITNNLQSGVSLHMTRNWNGVEVGGGYPPVLLPGETKEFRHGQDFEFGAIGAILYTVLHRDPAPQAATILVAWDYSVRSRRVYVSVGRRDKFEVMNWPEIRAELSKSGSESSDLDAWTRTSASAKLTPGGDLAIAKLEINFGAPAPS